MYSPGRGRFLSRDPAGETASLNLYEYGYNDPMSWGDPDGEFVIALATVWACAEVGLAIYDAYETYQTITDPCTGQTEKAVVTGLFVAGLLGPGGGGTGGFKIGKKAAEEIAEHGDDVVRHTLCFVAGTPVAMADGTSKPIEEVKAGDVVFSRDEATGKTEAREVTQTFERTADATLVLHLSNGESIETTEEHPFYVEGRGFTAAKALGIGTSIVTRAGPSVRVLSVERKDAPATVYNFEVEEYHTYFVGSSQVWVHNQCNPTELYHYTTEAGETGILNDMAINPSLNPKNARHGPGQYLTDIAPGQMTPGQLSRRIYGVPWNTKKVERAIKIDVTDLNVENPAPNIFRIPGETPLDITNRVK